MTFANQFSAVIKLIQNGVNGAIACEVLLWIQFFAHFILSPGIWMICTSINLTVAMIHVNGAVQSFAAGQELSYGPALIILFVLTCLYGIIGQFDSYEFISNLQPDSYGSSSGNDGGLDLNDMDFFSFSSG